MRASKSDESTNDDSRVVVQLELALEKQGKTEPISSHFWLLNAIFSIVKPSGKKVLF